MLDDDLPRFRAHRENIHRYRRLLCTQLSELERQFVQKRLAEEEAAFEASAAQAFPSTPFSVNRQNANMEAHP